MVPTLFMAYQDCATLPALPISVDAAMDLLGVNGFHGAQEQIEGAVWRVERRGVFDFMAKFVRLDKVDGKYLETITGLPPIVMASL